MPSSPGRPSAVPARRPAEWRWPIPLGLALLCLAVYANSFAAGFTLDSRQLVLQDPRVHALTRENLSLIAQHTYWWPYGESGLYRPLTTLSYLINYAGLDHADRPAGYHGVNLLFHIVNTLMLWRLTLRLTGGAWTSATAAALWAVAPLSTEAVTNIAGRADLMAATGTLGALLLHLRHEDRAEREPGRRGSPSAPSAWAGGAFSRAGVALAITAGLLAKESAISALGLVAACELVCGKPGRRLRTLSFTLLACAAPLGVWFIQRGAVLGASGAAEFPFTDNPIVGAPFWTGRLTAMLVIWRYLGLLIWPGGLSPDYSYAQIPVAAGTLAEWAAALALVGGFGALARLLRSYRPGLFFLLFAVIAFLPASSLVLETGTIMGERLAYLPSAGLAALAAIGLRQLGSTTSRLRVVSVFAALIIGGYGVRTHLRNLDWTNDLTLWQAAASTAPNSAKAHLALAEALYDSDPAHGRLDAVIAEAERSVALLGSLPDDRNMFQAFRQTASYYLDEANQVEAGPVGEASPVARNLYSRALGLATRATAIAQAGGRRIRGAATEPEADAERLRAAAMLGLADPASALVAANRARVLSPRNALAYRLSSAALLGVNRPDDAVITLLAGGIVSVDDGLVQMAVALYRDGIDAEGCALVGDGPATRLNLRCPAVLRHSCVATAAAAQIIEKAGEKDRAARTRADGAALGCSDDVVDRAAVLVP